jgi:hypothetical protein
MDDPFEEPVREKAEPGQQRGALRTSLSAAIREGAATAISYIAEILAF